MKVKVKGLVFVGFAAMIFAANAMAAPAAAGNQNTVTSKAYTEATYQHKSTAASIGNSSGTWTPLAGTVTDDETTAPTSAAVVDYVASQISTAGGSYQAASDEGDEYAVANGEGGWVALNSDISDTAAADQNFAGANGATSAAIRSFVDAEIAAQHTTDNTTYQAKSEALSIGNSSGGWTAVDATVSNNANSVPTSAAVKNYADSLIGGNVDSNNTTTAPTGATIAAALAAQPGATEYTGTGLIDVTGHQISTTAQVNVLEGVKVNGTALSIDTTDKTVNLGAAAGKGADTTVASTSTDANVPTSKAVYDYVRSQTGGTVIPQMDTTKCTASIPCALVAEANGEVHWRVMAVSEGQSPEAGTLADATTGA